MSSPTPSLGEQPTLVGDESSRTRPPGFETPLDPGTVVGRYVILDMLGKGGMGVVYAAYDPELDRKIALKLLLPGSGPDTEGRQRLIREAQAMAKLAHPNVVTVHDVGEHERGVFVAMEFVDGMTLREWLDAAPRRWREVLDRFLDAGEGLVAAHAAQLVHRDFKPENVMVARDGRVRVLDFGLVRPMTTDEAPPLRVELPRGLRSVDGTSAPETQAGVLMGTPAYMSPEQFLQREADARSDQFSFCVGLYEALYRRRPFGGLSLAELASNVVETNIEPPPRRHDVPKWIQRVVTKGLRREPDERHPSMQALLHALRRDPSRIRRRLVVVGAVGVLAAAAVGARQWTRARASAACERAGQALASARWTPAQRRTIEEAMLGQPFPFAAGTWERLEPTLDRYVDRWTDTAVAACHEHEVEGRWDDDLALRAEDCLTERRAAFEALADLLEAPSLEVSLNAEVTASRLPAPEECGDRATLELSPPTDPADRREVLAVRADLFRAEMELEAGRLAAGAERLEAAHARARALDRPRLSARIERQLGEAARLQGRYDDAAALLKSAYFELGRVEDDRIQLTAAISLVHLEAERRGNLAEAELWLGHAVMLHARIHGPAEPPSYSILRARAAVLAGRGDRDAALEAATEAEREAVRVLGAEHPALDSLRSMISRIEQERGNYELALEQTLARLERTRRLYGPEHPHVARAMINIATLQMQTGALDRAQESALEAVALNERNLGHDHPRTGHALQSLASVKTQRGETEEAVELLERAVKIYDQSGSVAIDGLSARLSLGGMLVQDKEHARALEVLETARTILARTPEDQQGPQLQLLINLGAAHRGLGDQDRAAEAYREAIVRAEATLPHDHPMIAYPLNNLGLLEQERGNYDEATSLLERALTIRRAKLGDDHPLLTGPLQGLAEVDLARRRPEQAEARLEEGLRILRARDAYPDRRRDMEALLERARAKATR